MKNGEFEAYFRKYKNLVIRLVMDQTGDYQTAQEICQQVFVAFYSNMDKVVPELVKAWLLRCAKNAVIDYHRSSRKKNEIFSETTISEMDESSALPVESIKDCEKRMVSRELAGRILKEIREVNENWYEVLVLHCIDGVSYADAAKRLNIPETVLRARLCRARAYVRKRYGKEYEDLRN